MPSDLQEYTLEDETAKGRALFENNCVLENGQGAGLLRYSVNDSSHYEVNISAENGVRCICAAFDAIGTCRHCVAAQMAAQQSGQLEVIQHMKAAAAGPRLMNAMENALPEDSTMKLECTLQTDRLVPGQKPRIRLGLRMGEERLYVVRSIPQIINAIDEGVAVEFGKGFSYQPDWMHPGRAENHVLDVLRSLCLAQEEANSTLRGAELRIMALPDPFAEALLKVLAEDETPFRMVVGDKTLQIKRVRKARVPLHYRVSGSARGLTITAMYPKEFQPLTESCAYVMINQAVVETEPGQQKLLQVLWKEGENGRASFEFPVRMANRVMGELVPFLKLGGTVDMDSSIERQMVRLPLKAQLYLDREDKEVVAKTRFLYGDNDIDPFDENVEEQTAITKSSKLLLRDAQAERRVLDALGSSGFHIRKGRVYLTGQDNIYDFVAGGIQKLQSLCEVFLSRDFRKLTPRKPTLSGRMVLSGSHLELVFTEDGKPAEEIFGILEALARRRRYFRLKDGSFLNLEDMDEWQQAAESIYEAAVLDGNVSNLQETDTITLSAFRTAYLTSLLDSVNLPVEVDDSARKAVKSLLEPDDKDIELPQGLELRPYQKRGYQWLMTLDRLHMGGILADDMGLGKTVQVIAMMKANRKAGETSLVVAPTSLTYNWLSELERFAPEMSVMVMGGTGAQRQSQIEHVKNAKDIDVLITSYPLIRRDIEQLKELDFRFVILDEAQHIKNAGSVGAVAVKLLHAQTRFALTGTPMENGTGELWSIFDFVLPGYLLGYTAFLRKYQDGEELDDLRRRIRPFLLRRLKKDVLTELPNKIETTMTAQMTPEQQKVYQAAMLRLKPKVDNIMREKGLGRGRTEVLSAITELRQVCCHPSLVMDDYTGSSGKLEMLLDFLQDAIGNGRRVLLFSQFTSMLKILNRHLETAGFECMYLDGDTPPSQRVELTAQFNGGKAQIFLISLKAGGTGLNLVGADMVIHYDPWWNPAAEDQATDRAHRIGQTHKVEVVRMVTHNSIEEQVVALGLRKKAIFDQLITPGEELVTALTEADIRALFS